MGGELQLHVMDCSDFARQQKLQGDFVIFFGENRHENRSLYGTRVLDSFFVHYPRSHPLNRQTAQVTTPQNPWLDCLQKVD